VDHRRSDYRDFQPLLNGRRIAKVGVQHSMGRIDVANKIVGEFVKLQRGRFFDAQLLRRSRPATLVVLVRLMTALSLASGCGKTNAAPTVPNPEVEVAVSETMELPVCEWT
jgi:hypothetical protein